MWVALIVLLLGIGGGVLYILTRPSPTHDGGAVVTPTATLTVDPATVEKGQSVTLHWSAQNASDLDLEPGVGKVQAQGSLSVTPQDSTTYTLTAAGPGGAQSPLAHVSVTIQPPRTPPKEVGPVTASLTLEPTRVEKGQSVKLLWDSQNATDLDLEPGVGRVPAAGSRSVTPQESTMYTLTATGPGGTKRPSAHVIVTNPPPPPPPIDQKAVRAAITMGDFLLGRGEYDDAIASYQKGLKLDPSNALLLQKLEAGIKACKKENAILNEGLKCGSH